MQEVARPPLLHLDWNCKNIQGAGFKQLLGNVTKVLWIHVVDVCLNDNDSIAPRLGGYRAIFSQHQPQAIRKVSELLGARTVADAICGKTLKRFKAVHDRSQDRRAGWRHELTSLIGRLQHRACALEDTKAGGRGERHPVLDSARSGQRRRKYLAHVKGMKEPESADHVSGGM